MVYKDKEKEKEYKKLWEENNKEKVKESKKLWRENNKEKKKKCDRLYYEKNKEKIIEQTKKYNKTENGIKLHIIKSWKSMGVKNDDFDKLYDYYLNCKFCEECNIDFTLCKKNLDHDHTNGLFRNVVCHSCNGKRGYRDRGHIYLTHSEKYWKRKLREFILS